MSLAGDPRIRAIRSVALRSAVVLATIQVVVGAVWWLANLTGLPAYGDTTEYLQLAEDPRVDGYRTLAYPLLLRLAATVTEPLGVPLQVPVYLLQTVVAAGAAWYLVRTAAPRATRRVVAFAAATVVTSPLVVHYAVSLLTDSLAASALVVAMAGLARVVVDGNTGRGTLAVTAGASLGAALLRTEKATVLLVVAAVTGAGMILARRRRASALTRGWMTPVAAVLVLAVPALVGSAINRATQTADYGRPEAGVAAAAMSRIVWPHLVEIRDELPADVRAQLSAEDATAFDNDNNYALWMVPRMRAMDGGGDDVVWSSVRAALRCCAVEVVAMTGLDVVEYAVAPVTFAVEVAPRAFTEDAPDASPSAWNVTRLSAYRPDLSRALLGVGFLLLAAQLIAVVANRTRSRAPVPPGARRRLTVLGLVWLGTAVNGCFFAFAMGADANVRYGLGTVMALTAALAMLFLRADDEGRPSPVQEQAPPR